MSIERKCKRIAHDGVIECNRQSGHKGLCYDEYFKIYWVGKRYYHFTGSGKK